MGDVGTCMGTDTCGILLIGVDGTVHNQVLDGGLQVGHTDDGSILHILVFTGHLVYEEGHGDTVKLAVERTFVGVFRRTHHVDELGVGRIVDIGRQNGINRCLTAIHQFGKGSQVIGRANLIDAVLLVQRPSIAAHQPHDGQREPCFQS